MIEAQARYIVDGIKQLQAKQADYMNVNADVQQSFNDKVQKQISTTVWNSGCTSWYQQENGKNFAIWPWSTWRFWLETRQFNLKDYTLGYARGIPKRQRRKASAEAEAKS